MRGQRRLAAFALAIAIAAPVAVMSSARAAASNGGPGCEAGVACADSDGDGFVACGCAPAGAMCDCDDGDPLSFPGAPETCDSVKDRNCDGKAGYSCGDNRGCLRSACVQQCVYLDDFGCGIGNHCEAQPNGQMLCAGPDCTAFGCPEGATCDDTKVCVLDCNASVKCPAGQICRGTTCVDPCDAVVCNAGAMCQNGRCLPSCDCATGGAGCPGGEVCDTTGAAAACVDPACVGVKCPGGDHCAAGKCVDDCDGVVCPPKLVCKHVARDGGTTRGECVDLCATSQCPPPMSCDWRTGLCLAAMFPEAGLVRPTGDGGEDDLLFAAGAGITCNTHGLARASGAGAGLCALAFGLLVVRSRRKKRH